MQVWVQLGALGRFSPARLWQQLPTASPQNRGSPHPPSQSPAGFGVTLARPREQCLPRLSPAPNKGFTLTNVLVGLSVVKSVSEKLIVLMLLISLSSACHLRQLWPAATKLAQGPPCSRGVLGPARWLPGTDQGCPCADVPWSGCQGCWGCRARAVFTNSPISAVSCPPDGSV